MAIDPKYKGKYNFSDGTDLLDLIQTSIIGGATPGPEGLVHTTGDETINGIKTFTQEIQGTVVKSKWADLAELYESDKKYEPGTLIKFGGEKQITLADTWADGVISDRPGMLLNSYCNGISLPVALIGQVPVKVKCPISKGYRVVLWKDGIGKPIEYANEHPLGIALEDKNIDGVELVNCLVRINIW